MHRVVLRYCFILRSLSPVMGGYRSEVNKNKVTDFPLWSTYITLFSTIYKSADRAVPVYGQRTFVKSGYSQLKGSLETGESGGGVLLGVMRDHSS